MDHPASVDTGAGGQVPLPLVPARLRDRVLVALRSLRSLARRARAGAVVAVTVITAMVLTLAVPATAAAAPADAAGPRADRPAAPTGSSTDAADGTVTIPLRDAVVIVVPDLSRSKARAELDRALRERDEAIRLQRAAMLRQQAAQSPQLTRTQQVDLRRLRALQEQARRAEAVRKAQADANRRLQEALEALAKALSSSSCTTVGGQNGTAASISCPLDNGGTGTVTGGGGTSVTPTPTTSPTPTPSPSATGQALTAASLPDAPVGPEDALTEGRLADALAQAKGEWADAGGDVSGITASIEDLSGATLGRSSGSSVVVDTDAAGWGWSQMSLVTVVRHEIGHVLGLDHTDGGLMDETLAPGQERGVGSAPALPHAEEPARARRRDPRRAADAGARGRARARRRRRDRRARDRHRAGADRR